MEKQKTVVYLSLGSNIGNKPQNLFDSINQIDQRIGRLVKSSNFYSTPPFQMDSDNEFWNACIQIETNVEPIELLKEIKEIESEMGRSEKSKHKKYSDRIIDIDILFYGEQVVDHPELSIPHPEWKNRLFVLIPLKELTDHLNIRENYYQIDKLINNTQTQATPERVLRFF
jgi:2-amino-4-hydroxy-6-hydroxymethyldihydropteridine diphosphokinase